MKDDLRGELIGKIEFGELAKRLAKLEEDSDELRVDTDR